MNNPEYQRNYYSSHRGLKAKLARNITIETISTGNRFMIGLKINSISLSNTFGGCYLCGCFLRRELDIKYGSNAKHIVKSLVASVYGGAL